MTHREIVDIIVKWCNAVLLGNGQATLTDLTAKEWNRLLYFASIQGVLPVIVHFLKNQNIQDEETRMVILEWYASAMESQQRYHMRQKTMRSMAKMFAEEGIDVMFLKGAALAQMYPMPELRAFNDIDYYLYGQSQKGIAVMAKKGIENSAYYHHHTQASLNGILLENHYDFVERINHRCDLVLDDALKALAASEGHSLKADFLGDDIDNAYLMTPTMNAIFLMRHMSAHFVGETIPLRMLYDWCLFLRCSGKDVDWKLVDRLYEESDMTTFAGIIQQLMKERLGVEFADCKQNTVDKKYVDSLWDSIIFPPKQDPYRKFSLRYYIFEARVFWDNRWKHRLVYPDESQTKLFFKYTWLGIKKMLGLVKLEDAEDNH